MFKLKIHLTLAICICLCSCNNELSMVTEIEDPEIAETDDCTIDSSGYKSHMIEFYTNFPYKFRVTPASFESRIDQILVKDAGTTESIYVQDSIQILFKDSYKTSRVVTNLDYIKITRDLCDSSTLSIPCIDSSYSSFHETITIGAIYDFIMYERLLTYDPNGDTIPAQYIEHSRLELVSDESIERLENYKNVISSEFILPDSIDISLYIQEVSSKLNFPNCLKEENYTIIN